MVIPLYVPQALLRVCRTERRTCSFFPMCRRTLYCFVLLTGEKRNNIKIIIDGSRQEAVEADVVEAEDAIFNLTPTKRGAPQDATRRAFFTPNPAVPRPHDRLFHSDCIELLVRFHPKGDADISLCPD